jgi:FKBP-type peptidyl-prolyl cis-trans isomerase
LTPEQNLARSQAFLAQNAGNPGVQVTSSGLQYRYDRVMPESGPRPTAADRVRVHYEGRLIDGQVFDSSFARGEPAEFPLGGVIAAWTEAVQLMRPGETITLWAPPELAYGNRGAGGGEIPANSALIFRVELLGFSRADGTTVTAP